MNAFIQYLKDVRSELTHVSWPSNQQAIGYTALVVGISIVVALVLLASDNIFENGLRGFLTLFQ